MTNSLNYLQVKHLFPNDRYEWKYEQCLLVPLHNVFYHENLTDQCLSSRRWSRVHQVLVFKKYLKQ